MPQVFNIGDRVRVKKDDESRRLAEAIGFGERYWDVVLIVSDQCHSNSDSRFEDCPYYCRNTALELVSPAPVPKKHARGLSLSKFLLCNRITGKKWTTDYLTTKKPVVRIPELQALHGQPFIRLSVTLPQPSWFSNLVNYSGVQFDAATKLITKATGQKMKATKWAQAVGVGDEKVQELARSLDAKLFDMTLSVRFKDLVRASVSRNFTSCWNESGITELLEIPHVAIAGCKDKHGDYLSRWIVWYDVDNKRCILNPLPYPQKYGWTKAEALTSKVGIWTNYGATNDLNREPWGSTKQRPFRTECLYNELDKGENFLKQLSLAEVSQANNEDDKEPTND